MKYGLKEESIKKIQKIFFDFPEIEKVILYGSRAMGNFKPGSDIDLTLKGDKLNHSMLNKISLKLDELLLPNIIDLSLYNQIDNSDLKEHISRVGIIFYEYNNTPK